MTARKRPTHVRLGGPEADARAAALKARFARVDIGAPAREPRHWRPLAGLGLCALAAILAASFYFSNTAHRGWSLAERAAHIAAAPNCDAARAVGLDNARRGTPGYYARHDADNDGIACEPYRIRY